MTLYAKHKQHEVAHTRSYYHSAIILYKEMNIHVQPSNHTVNGIFFVFKYFQKVIKFVHVLKLK